MGKSPLDLTPKSLDLKLTHLANTADMPDPSEWGVPVQPTLAPTDPPAILTTGSSPTVPTWHLDEDYLQLPVCLDPGDINIQIQQADLLNLVADLELSKLCCHPDSTDKEEEHVLDLHRVARMSLGERAHTSINLLDWLLRLPATPAVEFTTERTPTHKEWSPRNVIIIDAEDKEPANHSLVPYSPSPSPRLPPSLPLLKTV